MDRCNCFTDDQLCMYCQKLTEAQIEIERLRQQLDDIDTAGDMFKPEITPYFQYVAKKCREHLEEQSSGN